MAKVKLYDTTLRDGSQAEGISYSAMDNAGNVEAAKTLMVKIDKTAPTISASATKADSTPYIAGTWTNQNVTVHFAYGDSGMAS